MPRCTPGALEQVPHITCTSLDESASIYMCAGAAKPSDGLSGTLMVQTPIQATGSAEWAERRMSRQAVHLHIFFPLFQGTGSSAHCSLTALLLPPLCFRLPPPAGTLGACMCPTASSGCAHPPTPAAAHLMPIRQTPTNKHDSCALDAVRLPKAVHSVVMKLLLVKCQAG